MNTNFRISVHALIGLGCLVIACSDKSTPSTSTDTVSTPASEGARNASETSSEPPAESTPPSEAIPSEPPPVAVPEGDRCAGMECPGGYCDLHTVQCIRAPCPAQPTCVNGVHPCAATTCMANSRCESHDGQGVCIPLGGVDGVPCGKSTCGAGDVCCNESCGICTPPDGACTQQACSD